MKIKIMILCLMIFLGGCIDTGRVNPCNVQLGSHTEVTPVSKNAQEEPKWLPRHAKILERVKQGGVDLIMIGDSITSGWEDSGKKVWDEYYGHRNALNLGYGGDRTQHVLWRMQNGEIDGINPKLAIVLIGTNNSKSESATPERICDGIKAIVCELRNRLPNTKVLVLGIFPRRSKEQLENQSVVATYNPQQAKIDETNKLVSKIADNKMIYYLNINKVFLNDKGVLTRDVMTDLLHPGEKGYQIWAEAMEPTIVNLMGEKY